MHRHPTLLSVASVGAKPTVQKLQLQWQGITLRDIPFTYLSRVVLVPFAYQPPSVSAGTLDELLRKACAALPQAIVIGSTLMGLSGDIFKQVAAQIESTLTADGFTIDSRLEMQYAISIVCAQEVYTCYTVSSQ